MIDIKPGSTPSNGRSPATKEPLVGHVSPLKSTCQSLASALARSLAPVGFDPAKIRIVIEKPARRVLANLGGKRQFLVTFDDSSVTIAAEESHPDVADSQRTGNGGDPAEGLRESLFSAGIDPGAIGGEPEVEPELGNSTCNAA